MNNKDHIFKTNEYTDDAELELLTFGMQTITEGM